MIVLTNLPIPSRPPNYSWEFRYSLISMLSHLGRALKCSRLMFMRLLFSWDFIWMLHIASVSKHLHMIRLLSLKVFETVLLFVMVTVVSSLSLTVMNIRRRIHRPFCLKLDNCLRWTSKILTRGALIWYLLHGLTWRWRDRLPESESWFSLHHWACVLVHLLIIWMIIMSFITGVEASSV
jgi:hypothetical protein